MFSSFMRFRIRHASQITILVFLFTAVALNAQQNDVGFGTETSPRPSLNAKVLVGLPGINSGSSGDLSFNRNDLHFTTEHTSVEIPKSRILSASEGDERVELGGAAGKIARVMLPYGSGLALGAVAHKKVGLFTVEFLDASGQYHGAVFVLKTQDVALALADLDLHSPALLASKVNAAGTCSAMGVNPDTVRVENVAVDDQSGLPAEDRVLLYEQLVTRLQSEKSVRTVFRAGDRDPAAQCAEFTVRVQPIAFDKGDQAVRASLGPLGHFVGTTKLSFHLTITALNGTSILDKDVKKSEGSDSDSLNITKLISKAIVKSLRKSTVQLRKTQRA